MDQFLENLIKWIDGSNETTNEQAPASAPKPGSGMEGMAKEMLSDVLKGKHAYTQNFYEDVQAFVHAISWQKDIWIWGILGIELLLIFMTLGCRKSAEMLMGIFLLNTSVLYFGTRLNALGQEHWKEFSSQDYFDSAGVFFGVIVGIPLLLCNFLIVIFLLVEASSLLIRVKRMELQAAKKKKEEGKEGTDQQAKKEAKKDK
eukprot:TRINITY_DN27889_c0_g1_i1.p1 TRINITY_DN27889_c0_g1~~TRINITY_DN27889_c0_g1_i1.p1  ORF type:complete len:233 (+),score=34.21 TRINITY_DN27889_c0_g1_i1:95-700(+)